MSNSFEEKRREQVEIEKLIAEKEKIDIEKSMLEFEYKELKEESEKPWWVNRKFRQNLISIIIGLGFLSFYITMAVVPAANLENIRTKTSLALQVDTLNQNKKEILNLNSTLKEKITSQDIKEKTIDSLLNVLKQKDNLLTQAIIARNKFDSSFRKLLKDVGSNNILSKQQLKSSKGLYDKFQEKQDLYKKDPKMFPDIILHYNLEGHDYNGFNVNDFRMEVDGASGAKILSRGGNYLYSGKNTFTLFKSNNIVLTVTYDIPSNPRNSDANLNVNLSGANVILTMEDGTVLVRKAFRQFLNTK